jgi:hypothetical protein
LRRLPTLTTKPVLVEAPVHQRCVGVILQLQHLGALEIWRLAARAGVINLAC